jgi:hypothetical protein
MKQAWSRMLVLLLGSVLLPTGTALALESCNQVEVAPGHETTVSLLLPDIASDLRPELTVRDAHESASGNGWAACPTTQPYGACTHADVATVGTRKIVDPGDGKQLIAFRLRNRSASAKRDVRLCVQYGMHGMP